MVKAVLLTLAGLLLLGLHIERKRNGDFDHPVSLPSSCLSEIKPNSEKPEKISVQLMARPQQQESQDLLCFSFYNGSVYNLTRIECEILNQTTGYREKFLLFPVEGKWLNRDGFRKYYGEPKGIHRWSGSFGDKVNSKDRVDFRIVSATGFKS